MKDYIRDHIKPNERDTYYFDSYEPGELEQFIKQIFTDYQKKKT